MKACISKQDTQWWPPGHKCSLLTVKQCRKVWFWRLIWLLNVAVYLQTTLNKQQICKFVLVWDAGTLGQHLVAVKDVYFILLFFGKDKHKYVFLLFTSPKMADLDYTELHQSKVCIFTSLDWRGRCLCTFYKYEIQARLGELDFVCLKCKSQSLS